VAAVSGGRQHGNSCSGGQGNGEGWWGGEGDCSNSCHGVQRSSSDLISNHHSTGKSWSNASPNNDGRQRRRQRRRWPSSPGDGLQSYRIAPTLTVECSTLYTAAALASAVAAAVLVAAAAAALVASVAAVHILPTLEEGQ